MTDAITPAPKPTPLQTTSQILDPFAKEETDVRLDQQIRYCLDRRPLMLGALRLIETNRHIQQRSYWNGSVHVEKYLRFFAHLLTDNILA